MPKERLLIALLKSKRSIVELCKSKFDNAEKEKTKKSLNVLRDKFSIPKIKEIRGELHKTEKN